MSEARAAAFKEAAVLQGRGLRHYGESRLDATIELLRHSQELAKASGSIEMEDESRFWHGVALHGSGRLTEALAVWGPALSRGEGVALMRGRYMALTRVLMLIIDFPLPLPTIEKTIEDVERRLGAAITQGGHRRSRLLLARSRLELARGRFGAAFALAQEALHRQRSESEVYSLSTYYRTVVRAALSVGELESAEAYIQEWEVTEWAYPQSKKLLLASARANLARARGQVEECWSIAEPLRANALSVEDVATGHEARVAFVRACLASRSTARARSALAAILGGRRSPIGELRYDAYLLLGDYHRASLDELGDAGSGTSVGDHGRTVKRHLESARRAYGRALVEARRLDGLLHCGHRGQAVTRRLESLAPATGHGGPHDVGDPPPAVDPGDSA